MYLILLSLVIWLFSPLVLATDKPRHVDLTRHPSQLVGKNTISEGDVENIIKKYLVAHPEVVIEALDTYQKQQMQSMKKMFDKTQELANQNVDALFHQSNDPIIGNLQGTVSLVEFSDYQCGHCIESSPIINALLESNKDLKVIIKEFPIRGGISEEAALAALAANKQGKYTAFRAALVQNSTSLTTDKIYQLASTVGLDVQKLKKDMDSAELSSALSSTKNLATELKLVGTPALFIAKSSVSNGAKNNVISYVPGVISQQQLQGLLDKIKSGTMDDSSFATKN